MINALARTTAGLAGALLAIGATGAASAQTTTGRVVHGNFSSVDNYVDKDVCAPEGFSVRVHQLEAGRYTVLLDAAGNFVHAVVHMTYDASLSANGITLHEADRWNEMYYADGSHQIVGNTVHVTGPGGMVQLDAGRILFNPDGTVARISGPHPQFEGQTWCFALAP